MMVMVMVFQDRVSLYSNLCGTHCVIQADLELTEWPASAFNWNFGTKGMNCSLQDNKVVLNRYSLLWVMFWVMFHYN